MVECWKLQVVERTTLADLLDAHLRETVGLALVDTVATSRTPRPLLELLDAILESELANDFGDYTAETFEAVCYIEDFCVPCDLCRNQMLCPYDQYHDNQLLCRPGGR